MSLSLFSLLFVMACGGGSGSSGGTGSSSVAPGGGGGCSIVGLFCYDFVGTSWDAAAAEGRCDLISDDLVSGGWVPAVYDPTGCPGSATAECTGFEGIPGHPDSVIIIYYYEDPPMAVAEDACTDGGGTYTLY